MKPRDSLFSAARPPWQSLLPPALSGTVTAGCGIGLLATSGWLIARASERPPILALCVAIGAVQAFALARGVLRYVQRLGTHDVSFRFLGRLRLRMFDVLTTLVPAAEKGLGSGTVLAGFLSDAEKVTQGFAKRFTAWTDIVGSVAVGLVVTSLVEPLLGIIVAAGATTLIGSSLALNKLGRRAARVEASERAALADQVVETVRSARELSSFGREDLVFQALADLNSRSRRTSRRRAANVGVGRCASLLVGGAGLVGILCAGLSAADRGRLSGVAVTVTVLAALAVFDVCSSLPTVMDDLSTARAAAERIDRLTRVRPAARDPEQDSAVPDPLPGAQLDHATVTSATSVLMDDISLGVGPRERVALVGPNGSGKTTALHALLHFADCTAGRALVGNADVRHLSRATLASHLSWLPADTHLFSATLRDNLTIGRPGASDRECLDVLKLVGVHRWYETLPSGLDEMLGSGGRGVSAGERQRLGLARAILADRDIVLLDEPTSHLDVVGGCDLMESILGASAPVRSAVIVSHQGEIADRVDRVVSLRGSMRGT